MPFEVLTKKPYEVLARQWRPRGFEDLIGQDTAVKILQNAISQNRIAHAYIFSGPRGVGKTSAARIFARALNCAEGPTTSPCDKCPNCVSIRDGSFLDVIEIDGASNTGVDDIRELRERVKYAPSGAKYKIYIIDEAHMLSRSAFNALLKTLEEPPAHVIFIMATTEPKKIIPTVLSRCQHLPFKRISSDNIRQRLRFVSEATGFDITDGALSALAKAADGSMRDSLTLLDQIAAFSSGAITQDDVSTLTGISDMSTIAEAGRAIAAGDRKRILEIVSDLYEGGIDLQSFTRDLIEYFRDALVAACKGEAIAETVALNADEQELTVILGELLKTEGIVKNAESARAALEMCLIKISFLSSLRTISEIIHGLRSGSYSPVTPKAIVTVKAAQPAPQTLRPEPQLPQAVSQNDSTNESADPDESLWNRAMDRIYKTSAPLWSVLKDAAATVEGTAVTIVFSGGGAIHADSALGKKAIIEGVLNELTGNKYSVSVKTAKIEKVKEKDLRAEAMSNPVVKEALDLFGGAVVEVKPVVKK
ncbi:MAG: DNA polymerase III subunit gamma/tau [Candidatus Magnetominusculus sp. LBB02]|nr:DNA polymerase III subunit gamma/tau [Candidatus Magnetominusculus sp. LBB02]